MRLCTAPKSIDTDSFGRVVCPLQVNTEEGRLETYITYGIEDLTKLIGDAHWYYVFKSDTSQRQNEIADLLCKLEKLLKKEKSVVGRILSPIILEKAT